MYWDEKVVQKLEWNGEISNLEEKQKIADKIAGFAKDGDVIGVGSGSTSFLAVQAIAKRIKEEKLNIKAIPTSKELGMVCTYLGIPVQTLLTSKPDWCFEGADEVTPQKWLIKGRGAAMFREKLNIAESLNLKPNQTFLTTKYTMQSKYFKEEELRKILQEFIDLDYKVKSGAMDINIGLESILCRYCS